MFSYFHEISILLKLPLNMVCMSKLLGSMHDLLDADMGYTWNPKVCEACQLESLKGGKKTHLTLSPPNKSSSGKLPVCFNFQSTSMSPKICENVWVSNSLDPGEMLSYSASHQDPS